MFDERRAAQAASYLLFRAGGSMHLIKLLKLIYLAERLSFERYGEPLTGDRLVSMEHGPVLSRIYNHMNGAMRSEPGGWDSWISDRAEHKVSLRDPSALKSPEDDLLALSDSDLEVLSAVWDRFGSWDRWALVKYTHDELPEWEDPHGSSKPITYDRLFRALGYSDQQINHMLAHLHQQHEISKAFA
ncbi:Panacea domain-containing protein [Bordetella genomosp. 9]|nr:Panacea domain-containing protein [Bordetella genomosp. 9]